MDPPANDTTQSVHYANHEHDHGATPLVPHHADEHLPLIPQNIFSTPLSRSQSAERSPTYRRRDSSPSRLQTPRSVSGLPPASRIPQRNIKDLVNRFNQAAGHGERPLMPPTLKERYKRTEEQRAARLMKPRSPIKHKNHTLNTAQSQYQLKPDATRPSRALKHSASDGNLRGVGRPHALHRPTKDLFLDSALGSPIREVTTPKAKQTSPQMLHLPRQPSATRERAESAGDSWAEQKEQDRIPRPRQLTHPNSPQFPQSPTRQQRSTEPTSPTTLRKVSNVPPSPGRTSRLPLFKSRQPVASATTAASRARAAERVSRHDDRHRSDAHRRHHKPPELGRIDFGERRARIERALSQNLGEPLIASNRAVKGPSPLADGADADTLQDSQGDGHLSNGNEADPAEGRERQPRALSASKQDDDAEDTEFEEDASPSVASINNTTTWLAADSDESIQITPSELLHQVDYSQVHATPSQSSGRQQSSTGDSLHAESSTASHLPHTPVKDISINGIIYDIDETPRPPESLSLVTPQAHSRTVSASTETPTFMQRAISNYERTGQVDPALAQALGNGETGTATTANSDIATIQVHLDRNTYHPPPVQHVNPSDETARPEHVADKLPFSKYNVAHAEEPRDSMVNTSPGPSRSSYAEWQSDRPSTFASDFSSQRTTSEADTSEDIRDRSAPPSRNGEGVTGGQHPPLPNGQNASTPAMQRGDFLQSYSLPAIDVGGSLSGGFGLGLDLGSSPPWRPVSVPDMTPPRPQYAGEASHRHASQGGPPDAELKSPPGPLRRASEPSTPQIHLIPSTNKVEHGAFLDVAQVQSRNVSSPAIIANQIGSSQVSLATPSEVYSYATTPNEDQSEPTEADRRVSKRKHIIKELLDTERSYHQDITIIDNIYKATSDNFLSEADKKILFGNADQIATLSIAFYDALRDAVAPFYVPKKDKRWNARRASGVASSEQGSPQVTELTNEETDRLTAVGACFAAYLPRIEQSYTVYVNNHEAANKRLAVLQNDKSVSVWLKACHENANDITSAWDLDSLLVKPVQRILKYPLLLQQLISTTPDDHPDRSALDKALVEATSISHRINESKGRSRVVGTVASQRQRKDSELRSGLTKMFGMRNDKTKDRIVLKVDYQDPVFEELSHKFGGHFLRMQIVVRDIDASMEAFDKTIGKFGDLATAFEQYLNNGANIYPEIESKWRKFIVASRELVGGTAALKEQVQQRVITPIKTCIKLHEGPQNVMAKRKKRIPEFMKRKEMEKAGQKPDRKTIEGAELYVALNDQLKLDLPKLYELTARLVLRCLVCYHDIQMSWFQTWQTKMLAIVNMAPETFDEITEEHGNIFPLLQEQAYTLSIANGSLLAEAERFLSPQISFTEDSRSSWKRSSHTQSINSEVSSTLYPYETSRGYSVASLAPDSPGARSDHRTRSMSNLSVGRSRAPSAAGYPAPRLGPQTPTHSFSASRPANASRPSDIRPASASIVPAPLSSGLPSSAVGGGHGYTLSRSSAEPSPRISYPPTTSPSQGAQFAPIDAVPAFIAVSLYAFNIDRTRREQGLPYLTYDKGEVFEVLRQQGELWLAWNQDDPAREVGWIWEQHFVVLGEE